MRALLGVAAAPAPVGARPQRAPRLTLAEGALRAAVRLVPRVLGVSVVVWWLVAVAVVVMVVMAEMIVVPVVAEVGCGCGHLEVPRDGFGERLLLPPSGVTVGGALGDRGLQGALG